MEDFGFNDPSLKGLKFKNGWFRPGTARPSQAGSGYRVLCCAGCCNELARESAGISHSVADSPGPRMYVYWSDFDC